MPIEAPYHEGERAVQELTGEQGNAVRNGRAVSDAIMSGALKFIAQQKMLVLASIDAHDAVWASLLTGPAGFAQAPDPRAVTLDTRHAGSHGRDPLWSNLESDQRVGALAIELASRRRLRLNGRLSAGDDRTYTLNVEEAYPNCPQYIQRRDVHLIEAGPAVDDTDVARSGTALDTAHRAWIESADTFFVASAHPTRGADASHRGGKPGFVRLRSEQTLRVPDYSGNSMYNTLGNFRVNPHAGLLFVDFERARTLQLTGRAILHLDENDDPEQPTGGTNRYWDFTVDRWIDAAMSFPIRAEFLDAWPKHPQR